MISARYCQMMAAYNAWMNTRTYDCCGQLDDAERKRDRGAFFGSIHRTLNHLLWGDRVWLPRFGGPKLPVGKAGEDLYADFAELRAARAQMDAHISDWAARVDDAALAGDLTWYSGVAQRELTRPMALCVDADVQPPDASSRAGRHAAQAGRHRPRRHRPAGRAAGARRCRTHRRRRGLRALGRGGWTVSGGCARARAPRTAGRVRRRGVVRGD